MQEPGSRHRWTWHPYLADAANRRFHQSDDRLFSVSALLNSETGLLPLRSRMLPAPAITSLSSEALKFG
jgi:hypothetical protein